MTSKLLIAAAIFAAAVTTGSAGPLLHGHCRQGECSHLSIEESDIVATSPGGNALFQVRSKMWTSRNSKKRVLDGESTNYVYCSKQRPAALYKSEGGYRVDFLAPNQDMSYSGANTESYLLYYATCHNIALQGSLDRAALGKRLGYRLAEDSWFDQPTIKRPEDIIGYRD